MAGTVSGGIPETQVTDTFPLALDTPLTAWLYFTNNSVSGYDLNLYASLELSTGASTNGGRDYLIATSSAAYTFEILGLTLQTSSGENVAGASLTSASGFDYNAVPEPSTYAMLVVGGTALGLGLSRRRTAQ